MDSHEKSLLEKLPNEILFDILQGSCLEPADAKALRLTCRALHEQATSVLFSRLYISSLHRDRDIFRNIVASPHLAKNVQELVWLEITVDARRFLAFRQESWQASGILDDPIPGLDEIFRQAVSLFWLKQGGNVNTQAAVDSFLPEFKEAVASLPRLRGFISQPMHCDRELQPASESSYPVTAGILQRHLHPSIGSSEGWPDFHNTRGNIGFREFLLPVINWAVSTATRLIYADEHNHRSSLSFADSVYPFQHLEEIDLYISEQRLEDNERLKSALFTFLHGAPKLQTLRLYRGGSLDYFRPDHTPVQPFNFPAQMPVLSCLELSYLDLSDLRCMGGLVELIRNHRETIRHLSLLKMPITRKMLLKLGDIKGLNLSSCVLTPHREDRSPVRIGERELLQELNSDENKLSKILPVHFDEAECSTEPKPSFIGNGHEYIPQEPATKEIKDNPAVVTLDGGYGDWAIMDQPYSLGPCRRWDPITCLWFDFEGVGYDPRTDTEILWPENKSYAVEQNSWRVQNGRSWISKLGMWQDQAESPNGMRKMHKFAVDRSSIERPKLDIELEAVDKDISTVDESDKPADEEDGPKLRSDYEDRPDGRADYEKEDQEQILRAYQSPRWKWERDMDGTLWYWKADWADETAYATQVWLFKHRNGEEAYHNDPLEVWSDWEGSDAGDVAEPTPYGERLWQFNNEHQKIFFPGNDFDPSSVPNAMEYDPWDDPAKGFNFLD